MNARTILLALAAASCAWLPAARGQSAFVGTSGGVTRQGLGLHGGFVEDIAIAANGKLYVALNSPTGVFISTDSAATWRAAPSGRDFGNVSAVEVGETGDTIYFIGGIRLYKSTDAGATFSEITMTGVNSNFDQCLLYHNDGTTPVLLVPYQDGTLYRSTNGGTSFTNITIGAAVTRILDLAASPTGGTFYALVSGAAGAVAIYRSVDYGNTWTNLVAAPANACDTLAVNPADADELVATGVDLAYISTNAGAAWTNVSAAYGGSIKHYVSFSGNRIYAGSKYSDDNGVNWSEYNGIVTSTDTRLLGYYIRDPATPTTLYMASMRGLAKSTNSGANWSDAVTGMFGVVVSAIDQAADKNIVYLAATAGIAKSTNFTGAGGPTWTYPLGISFAGDSALAVCIVDPYNPTSATQTVLAGSGIKISRSTNGGTTWAQATITPALAARDAVTDLARGALALYATYKNVDADTGGVIYSTDRGATWANMSLTNSAPANTIATRPVYAALTGMLLFASGSAAVTGAGARFTTELRAGDVIIFDADASGVHTQPIPWATVAAVANNSNLTLTEPYHGTGGLGAGSAVAGDTLIVGAGEESNATAAARGIFTTTFTGGPVAWTEVTDTDVDSALITDVVVVASTTANKVYAAAAAVGMLGTVLRSTDAGATWADLRTVGTGLPNDGWFRSLAVDTADTNIVFAASGRSAANARIYRTTDGGNTWSLYFTALIDEAPNAMLVDALTVGLNSGLFSFTGAGAGTGAGSGGAGGGTCFIATAAFGSPLEPRVCVLQEFRDRYLVTNWVGTKMVEAYYRHSPRLADFLSDHAAARAVARWALVPVVGLCRLTLACGLWIALALAVAAGLAPAAYLRKRLGRRARGPGMVQVN